MLNSINQTGRYIFQRFISECKTQFSDKGKIVTQDLQSLLTRKIDCLVVEGFLRDEQLKTEQRLIAGYHPTTMSLPKDRINWGFASEDTINDGNLRFYYHFSAQKTLESYRENAHPYLTWFDKLRLDLDVAHESGTCLKLASEPLRQPFIARGYDWASPSNVQARQLHASYAERNFTNQLVAMQILVAPEKGGQLELYPTSLSKEEMKDLSEKKIEIMNDTLPAPAAAIKPFAGRLVLFHADIPFKISPVLAGDPINQKGDKKEISLVVQETYIVQRGRNGPLALLR